MGAIKENLMQNARKNGICSDGYKRIANSNIDELIAFYLESPDWCLERNFPSLKVLRDHFRDITEMGVFVDRTFHGEILNDLQTYIFHHCKGTIRVGLNVEKAIIPMLYLANGCRLRFLGAGEKVEPQNRPVVPVYVFGKNDLSAKDNRYVTFRTYKSGLV